MSSDFIALDLPITIKSWDYNELLFSNFLIFGPESIEQNSKPKCLFHFSYKSLNRKENIIQKQKSNSEFNSLSNFFFHDGIHYRENLNMASFDLMVKPPEFYDFIIHITHDTKYYFCARYMCTPYSRPAVLSFNEGNDEKKYFETMKNSFIKDSKKLSNKNCPTCLFAFCFETRCPFPSLFLELIKRIVHFQTINDNSNDNITPDNNNAVDNYIEKSKDFSWIEISWKNRITLLTKIIENGSFQKAGKNLFSNIFPDFKWIVPSLERYVTEFIKFGISPLLEWINLNDFLKLLASLFLEKNIYVIGSKEESVNHVVSGFYHLLFPFSFEGKIITNFPVTFDKEFLNPPVGSMIIGIVLSGEMIEKLSIFSEEEDEYVIVDMDEHEINWPKKTYTIANYTCYSDSLKKFCFKDTNRKIIVDQTIFKSIKSQRISHFISPKIVIKRSEENNEILYFNIDKIDDIVECILKNNEKTLADIKIDGLLITNLGSEDPNNDIKTGFNFEWYKDLFNENDKEFVQQFVNTQAFQQFLGQKCKAQSDIYKGVFSYPSDQIDEA